MQPSFPQLMVRPVVDPRIVPLLKATEGYRPAATVTLGFKRQSKLELSRNFDNAKRRWEDWEKRHASAEPVMIGSFPTFSASGTKGLTLVGAVQPGQEIREFQIVVEGNLSVNAGTGIVQAADHNVLAAGAFNKIRASLYGIGDAFNLFPAECRTIAFIADGRDPFTQDPNLRLGTALSTVAKPVKLKFKIPFCVRNLEVPEIFSPTSDQTNLAGSKVDLDTNGTALTALGLSSGPGTFAITDIKLYAILNQIPVLHAGPPHLWRSRQLASNTDTESGQGMQIFLGTEEAATATGAGARVSQYTVKRDGRPQPSNIDPVTLAQNFNESNFSVDGLAPLDITIGAIPRGGNATAAQPIPDGFIGSQAGAQVVPLVWNDGKIRAGAWQWATWLANLIVQQNMISGANASIIELFWQVRPIYECAGQVSAIASANGLTIASIDELKVRGGNDGEVYKNFKGRFMQRKAPPATNMNRGAS